jgi:hypothetical protein
MTTGRDACDSPTDLTINPMEVSHGQGYEEIYAVTDQA